MFLHDRSSPTLDVGRGRVMLPAHLVVLDRVRGVLNSNRDQLGQKIVIDAFPSARRPGFAARGRYKRPFGETKD
jgi:hypothetical protein